MVIGRLLYQTACRLPDNVAIVDGATSVRYADWNRHVNALANGMATRLGIGKGDRVGVFAYNTVELLSVAMALQKLGAVYVSINFRLSIDELRFQIEDSKLAVLFYDAELGEVVLPVRRQNI